MSRSRRDPSAIRSVPLSSAAVGPSSRICPPWPRLAHYKCPRSISFEAQLPRTDTGKLYKQELIKKYS
jgi:acyl-CoA synthetase (AMP-forming)/AMP-acid ligase II